MAAPITSQVHSMHAITKVPKGREEKKERKKGAKEQKKQQDRGAGANVTWLQQINMSSLQLIWKRMNLWYLHLLFRNTSLSFTWTLCQKTIHTEVQNRYSDSRCCWLDLLQPAMFTKSSVHVIFYSYTKRIKFKTFLIPRWIIWYPFNVKQRVKVTVIIATHFCMVFANPAQKSTENSKLSIALIHK